jgi:predicted  nucleic acid-binding Zn-ribbon protein
MNDEELQSVLEQLGGQISQLSIGLAAANARNARLEKELADATAAPADSE